MGTDGGMPATIALPITTRTRRTEMAMHMAFCVIATTLTRRRIPATRRALPQRIVRMAGTTIVTD